MVSGKGTKHSPWSMEPPANGFILKRTCQRDNKDNFVLLCVFFLNLWGKMYQNKCFFVTNFFFTGMGLPLIAYIFFPPSSNKTLYSAFGSLIFCLSNNVKTLLICWSVFCVCLIKNCNRCRDGRCHLGVQFRCVRCQPRNYTDHKKWLHTVLCLFILLVWA